MMAAEARTSRRVFSSNVCWIACRTDGAMQSLTKSDSNERLPQDACNCSDNQRAGRGSPRVRRASLDYCQVGSVKRRHASQRRINQCV